MIRYRLAFGRGRDIDFLAWISAPDDVAAIAQARAICHEEQARHACLETLTDSGYRRVWEIRG